MRVRFWGTRGSIARPGPHTLRYGGNTSCVEVLTERGTRLVLDCGTGAYALGQQLLGEGGASGHLLITHTHWDHIQGFPFFTPLFIPKNRWEIYAPGASGQGLEAALRGQMEYAYFPVALDEMGAAITFNDLSEGTFTLGEDVRVTARYLNHPAVALGYRIEVGGVVIVYATDHEPHSRHQAEPKTGPTAGVRPLLIHVEDGKHAEFLADADLVIHDTQYTAAEYGKKVGWGHSTVEYAVDVAVAARAKRLALFHHDPQRTDAALEVVLESGRDRARAWGSPLEVVAAAEGQVLEFPESPFVPPAALVANADPAAGKAGRPKILVVDDDPDFRDLASVFLRDDGYHLLLVASGQAALVAARAERPDLILLDWEMPDMDGLQVCRALRAEAALGLDAVPIILLTARTGAADTKGGFEAGANDYVTKPFTPAHLRSRVREWLARSASPPTSPV
jgi:CheY-like chemotaxis protein/phosphoribosyl 1,2-cyclic phosphodiesterase